MRIAILAPLKRPITPEVTASRPRVIFDLVSELVKRGHKVTIFGPGDSNVPGAEIVPVIPQALNLLPVSENPFYQHTAALTCMIAMALERQDEFDVIHNHMYPEFLALLALPALRVPLLTTVHAQMTPELSQVLKAFPEAHLVAISEAAKKASGITSMTVIHNGIDTDFFVPASPEGVPDKPQSRDCLLFVGRMSKARDEKGNFLDPKGVSHAIKVAQISGEKLKIVGNVEDPAFFETLIKPHLSDKIEFVGEVSAEQSLTREQMRELFAGAKAFLFPINWEEPFGLVMAEAMSCGTPVIAFNRGSVSELIVDGKTGFVVDPPDNIAAFVSKLNKLSQISPTDCRNHAVANFSKARMAVEYEKLYGTLIGKA